MSSSKKALVPVADGTEPMEAVITIDVLRRSGADVTVASAENGKICVDAFWGVKIVADSLISDVSDDRFDLIALPGGIPGPETLRDSEILEGMVRKHAKDGGFLSAICAAPAAHIAELLLEQID